MMKQLKFFIALTFSACLLFFYACNNSSGKTSTDTKTSASSANRTPSDANGTGNAASFSYTVNGQHVQTVNNVQHATLFINEVSNDATNGMAGIKVTCLGSSVFNFEIANSGTTVIDNYSPSLSGFSDKKAKAATYMDGKTYKNFYAVSVTVTITGIDESRIRGTFSGTFKADESDGHEVLTITDGSFNLPFEKS